MGNFLTPYFFVTSTLSYYCIQDIKPTFPSLKADCFVLRTLAIATYIRNPPYRATCSYWWCAKYLRIPLCKHSVFSNAWLYFSYKMLAKRLHIANNHLRNNQRIFRLSDDCHRKLNKQRLQVTQAIPYCRRG